MTDRPTNYAQQSVSETPKSPLWIKITLMAIATLFIILSIVFFAKDARMKFDLIFCETDEANLGFGAAVIALIALIALAYQFGEKRSAKVYLNSKGQLDISTPRHYTPLQVPAITSFLGRTNYFVGRSLADFNYTEGHLHIESTDGSVIDAPISTLSWKYSTAKDQVTGGFFIYKYVITDQNGNKVRFNANNATFMPEEWDDINMILSQCGEVKESKVTKFTKKYSKLLENLKDFDFSSITDAATGIAGAKFADVSNAVIDNVKASIYKKAEKRGLKKYFDNTLMVVVVIYLVLVVIINVCNFFEMMSSKDEVIQYDTEEVVETEDETEVTTPTEDYSTHESYENYQYDTGGDPAIEDDDDYETEGDYGN